MCKFILPLPGCIFCMESYSNGQELYQWQNVPWEEVSPHTPHTHTHTHTQDTHTHTHTHTHTQDTHAHNTPTHTRARAPTHTRRARTHTHTMMWPALQLLIIYCSHSYLLEQFITHEGTCRIIEVNLKFSINHSLSATVFRLSILPPHCQTTVKTYQIIAEWVLMCVCVCVHVHLPLRFYVLYVCLRAVCYVCPCRYGDDLGLEDAVHTAVLTLKVNLNWQYYQTF